MGVDCHFDPNSNSYLLHKTVLVPLPVLYSLVCKKGNVRFLSCLHYNVVANDLLSNPQAGGT